MRIYNTLTRQKEEFVPITPGEVNIYVCGPTVYNLAHMGNARPICVFDVLRRYMEYCGLEVTLISNFTDVDDKIIARSIEEGIGADQVSEKYIAEYMTDLKGLGALPSTYSPKVTENIDAIIRFVELLVENGHAYESAGDVYFNTSSFAEYGKLSQMPLEDLQAGARVDVSTQKRDPMDFALWKAAKQGEPFWPSPWSNGRPGWHIECSAMCHKYAGKTLDIHGGGQDLLFPHHENEIAQTEAATGKPLSKYWMHNGRIDVDGKKMGKSLNNFFLIRDVANEYGYEVIRFFIIQSHYRSPINFSHELLDSAKTALSRIYNCSDTLKRILNNENITSKMTENLGVRKKQFIDAMEDDLNTADAIAAIFDLVRDLNTLAAVESPDKAVISAGYSLLMELCGILGILRTQSPHEESIPESVLMLVNERTEARRSKDFALADRLRQKIADMGYTIEETRQGTRIVKTDTII